MSIQGLDEATRDLADGCCFYERQTEGLGDYFLDSLWSDIISLRLHAGVDAIYHGYHRLLSKRLPFAIYYRIDDGIARVSSTNRLPSRSGMDFGTIKMSSESSLRAYALSRATPGRRWKSIARLRSYNSKILYKIRLFFGMSNLDQFVC